MRKCRSFELGEHHAGHLKRESADAKVERIIAEELRRLRWTTTSNFGSEAIPPN